jgi:hypothetical protein
MKNLFKILSLMIFFTSCTENVIESIHGCFDSEACNYNPDATFDNNSCEFESCKDCTGVQFGDAKEDDCGICLGDNTYCLPIELSFGNIYTNEQEQTEAEISIDTPQNLTAFQFDLIDTEILSGTGGLCEEYGFYIHLNPDTLDTTILGFSQTGNNIPSGSNDILINLIFNTFSDEICLELGNGRFIKIIQGIQTFEDLNHNQQWDDGEECFYNTTDNDCEGTQLILENWNDLIDEYGLERTLEELYDRSDGYNEDIISYTVNFGDCITIPTLN